MAKLMNTEAPNQTKALQVFPLGEIDKFPAWAQRCITRYAASQNFYQTFQVSHCVMIFASIFATRLTPSDTWLWKSANSALLILSKINETETSIKLDDELLATLLLIKEYFVINNCSEPNSCILDITKVWIEPEYEAAYYLEKFNLNYEILSS
jgi:hypothetical protein